MQVASRKGWPCWSASLCRMGGEQRKSAGEHQDPFHLQLGDILCLAFPPHSFLLFYVRTGTVIMGRARRKAGKREMFAQASRTFMRLGDERVRVKCLLSLDCQNPLQAKQGSLPALPVLLRQDVGQRQENPWRPKGPLAWCSLQ